MRESAALKRLIAVRLRTGLSGGSKHCLSMCRSDYSSLLEIVLCTICTTSLRIAIGRTHLWNDRFTKQRRRRVSPRFGAVCLRTSESAIWSNAKWLIQPRYQCGVPTIYGFPPHPWLGASRFCVSRQRSAEKVSAVSTLIASCSTGCRQPGCQPLLIHRGNTPL